MSKVPRDFLQENANRYRNLIKGRPVDYAPFRLWLDDTFVRHYTKISPEKYFNDIDVMLNAQMVVNDRFCDLLDFTVNMSYYDIYFDNTKFLTDNPGAVPYRVLGRSLDDFSRYYTRKKIGEIPAVKRLIEAIEYCNKKLPKHKKMNFYFGVTGAMDLYSIFRGTEKFFTDFYDNSQKVKQIFEFITERSLEWLEFEKSTWGDYNRFNYLFDKIDIGEDYCAYLPPDLFDEFVKPYTGKIMQKYKGKVCCSLHTDGDIVTSGIHKLGELGIDELMGFSPNIDIKEFRKALPDVILGGNIHPIKVMNEGTPEDVKAAARYCFESANQNQKFVLCTGGSISDGAKTENVDAFIEATYEITKY